MSARDEIQQVCRELALAAEDGTFTTAQVRAAMRARGSVYPEATINTHVSSRMCADSPDNHGTTYADLRRVERGIYRLA